LGQGKYAAERIIRQRAQTLLCASLARPDGWQNGLSVPSCNRKRSSPWQACRERSIRQRASQLLYSRSVQERKAKERVSVRSSRRSADHLGQGKYAGERIIRQRAQTLLCASLARPDG